MQFSETYEFQWDVDVDITWDVYIGSSTWVTCDIDIAREGARDLSHFRKARGLGV